MVGPYIYVNFFWGLCEIFLFDFEKNENSDYNNLECDCDTHHAQSDCGATYKDYNVNSIMLGGMVAIGVIEICCCLLLFWWVWKHRTVREVKAMSITFTNLTLIGFVLIAASGVVIGAGYTGSFSFTALSSPFLGFILNLL